MNPSISTKRFVWNLEKEEVSSVYLSFFLFKYDITWIEGKLTCTKADHFLFIRLVYCIPVSVYSKRHSGLDQWEIQFQLPWLLIKTSFCQKQHWDQIHPLMPGCLTWNRDENPYDMIHWVNSILQTQPNTDKLTNINKWFLGKSQYSYY